MSKFAVMIDIDGDFVYVPKKSDVFRNSDEPKLFDTIEEAQEERDKWNTGVVVDHPHIRETD